MLFRSDEVTDDTSTTRRWNDYKKKEMQKGAFTENEKEKIIEAVFQYGYDNNLSENELLALITDKQIKSDKTIWPTIAECLQDRSVQSIHNLCKRIFNPYNYKGEWTQDEVDKLMRYTHIYKFKSM